MSSLTRMSWLAVLLVGAGCRGACARDGGGSAGSAPSTAPAVAAVAPASECVAACEQDKSMKVLQYCGTDKKTYAGCQWQCSEVPAGVSVWPSACATDGSPAPGGPPYPADGDRICDWSKTGTSWVPFECAEDLDGVVDTGRDLGGAAGDFDQSAATPPEVDHRARYGPIKNQGTAPTCISFAATAGAEGAVFSATRDKIVLSEMHLFSRYRSTQYADMAKALGDGFASAEDAQQLGFGYDPDRAARWLCGNGDPNAATPGCKPEQPDPDVAAKLDEKTSFAVSAVERIEAPTVDKLKSAIGGGLDVIVGFRMNDNWYANNLLEGGIIDDYEEDKRFGHAVLLVGYKPIDDRLYFEIRNSWGPSWGNGGYGYISADNAIKHIQAAYTVSVRGVGAPPDCDDGYAAGIDGTCKRICPDESLADANDKCTGDGECEKGQVADDSGVCVNACNDFARDVEGADVTCKGRGCTWVLADGAFGCKAKKPGGTCEQYCGAPNCQVNTSKNEFGVDVTTCVPDDD